MPVKLSANLGFLYHELPLLERIDAAAADGFPAVEFHWPYDIPLDVLKVRCDAVKVAVVGVNTVRGDISKGENGLAALPGREAEFAQAFTQALTYAKGLNASGIHVMAGKTAGLDQAACRKTFLANLRRASEEAEGSGVTLLLEALNRHDAPGYFYHTYEQAAEVIAEAGAPNIKLMFDCYHAAIEGGDLVRRMEKLWPLIGHLQFAAVPDRGEPDEGEIDYRFVLKRIAALGWPGFVGAEYKPRSGTRAGLSWREACGV